MNRLKSQELLELSTSLQVEEPPVSTSRNYSCSEDFQILRRLGQGSYSIVFKVRRLVDDQLYALKKIKMVNLGRFQRESALNEVRILASVQHEHIIGYKEAFFERGYLYLVLEYADNGDLLHQISVKRKQKEYFSQVEIWQILLQMTEALFTLHQLNIVHRDVKSANIFLTKAGLAKLGDLNVSKVVDHFCQTQTGTPYYASPEIWHQQPYDKRCDLWSLGCTIYEMATYYPPFVGEDLQQLCEQITKKPYYPMPSFYSKQLHKLIGRMLQKDPKIRCSAEYIIENVEKLVPQAIKSLAIVAKLKQKYGKQGYRVMPAELLKTITFPRNSFKLGDSGEANSYLPSPTYSPEHHHSHSITFDVELMREGLKRVKPTSLFLKVEGGIRRSHQKQNSTLYKKGKRGKSKGAEEMRLPIIQKRK